MAIYLSMPENRERVLITVERVERVERFVIAAKRMERIVYIMKEGELG